MSADLDALSREIAATSDAVRLAIAAVKANPPHPESPMPWRRKDGSIGEVLAADDSLVCEMAVDEDAAHIAAAVNAAPVLLAEVERLQSLLATSERLRQMEAQAVAHAIRAPYGPPRVPSNLIFAMRAVTLPEDFLPAVERICAENESLKAKVAELEARLEAARVAVAEMGQDHRNDCARIILGQWGRECDCGWAEILAARRALGLEVAG